MNKNNLEREASDWVIKHDRGLTGAEQDEFLDWLAADPQHGEAFTRQRRAWQDFDVSEEWRPKHSATPNPDLLARNWRSRSLRWAKYGLPMAAAATLALYLPTRFSPPKTPTPMPESTQRIVAADYLLHELPDGSEIDLNAGAEVIVNYSAERRSILLLAGEAYFTVTKDATRPFVVTAAGAEVRAVGTAFNVRVATDSVEVLVTSGKVVVDRSADNAKSAGPTRTVAATVELEPGQQSIWSLSPTNSQWTTREVAFTEIDQILEWKPELFEFASTPLADVVEQFNRHNKVHVVIADDALRSTPIVASFRSNNVDGFVRLLEMTDQVRAERNGRDKIILHTR